MATRWDIELKLPRVVFMDGSYCTVYREGIPTGTPEKKLLTLLPHSPSIRKANIEPDMERLSEPNPQLSIHNNLVFRHWYNTDYIIPLSLHPEWNLWLAMCNIRGEKINPSSPTWSGFNRLQNSLESVRNENKQLRLQISHMGKRIENLTLLATQNLTEKFGDDDKDNLRKILPSEYMGLVQGGNRQERQ